MRRNRIPFCTAFQAGRNIEAKKLGKPMHIEVERMPKQGSIHSFKVFVTYEYLWRSGESISEEEVIELVRRKHEAE